MQIAEKLKRDDFGIQDGDIIRYDGKLCMIVNGYSLIRGNADIFLLALEGDHVGELIADFVKYSDITDNERYKGKILGAEFVYITSLEEAKQC